MNFYPFVYYISNQRCQFE